MALDYHSVDDSTTINSGNNPGIDDTHRMWHTADLETDEMLFKIKFTGSSGDIARRFVLLLSCYCLKPACTLIITAVGINFFLWLSTVRVKTKQNRTLRNRWCKNICLNLLLC